MLWSFLTHDNKFPLLLSLHISHRPPFKPSVGALGSLESVLTYFRSHLFFIFFFFVGHKWDQLDWVSGLKSHRLNQRLGVKSTEGLTSGFQDGSLTRLLAGSLNLSLASGRSSQFLTVNLTHIAVWGSWQLTSHQANDPKQKEKAVAAVYLTT